MACFSVVTADGQYLKYSYTAKGEYSRDMCTQFMELVSDRSSDDEDDYND